MIFERFFYILRPAFGHGRLHFLIMEASTRINNNLLRADPWGTPLVNWKDPVDWPFMETIMELRWILSALVISGGRFISSSKTIR